LDFIFYIIFFIAGAGIGYIRGYSKGTRDAEAETKLLFQQSDTFVAKLQGLATKVKEERK
jgi:hypothetical protein